VRADWLHSFQQVLIDARVAQSQCVLVEPVAVEHVPVSAPACKVAPADEPSNYLPIVFREQLKEWIIGLKYKAVTVKFNAPECNPIN
jgi:hypothetical protein